MIFFYDKDDEGLAAEYLAESTDIASKSGVGEGV
jgi:hypothetical protein